MCVCPPSENHSLARNRAGNDVERRRRCRVSQENARVHIDHTSTDWSNLVELFTHKYSLAQQAYLQADRLQLGQQIQVHKVLLAEQTGALAAAVNRGRLRNEWWKMGVSDFV